MQTSQEIIEVIRRAISGERNASLDEEQLSDPALRDAVNGLIHEFVNAAYKRDLYHRALGDMARQFEETVGFLSVVKRLSDLLGEGGTDANEACQSVVRILVEEAQVENCSILLLHPREHVLALVAADGQEDRLRRAGGASVERRYNRFLRFRPGEGIAGRVAETLEPYLCQSVEHDALYLDLGSVTPIQSLFVLPLAHDGRLLGVLNISDKSVHHFHEHRRRGLTLIADVIARVLVFIEQRRQLAESEAFYRELMENAGEVIGALDLGLCFTFLNRAGQRLLGLEESGAAGYPLLRCVAAEDEELVRECVHRLIYGKDSVPRAVRFHLPGGDTVILECSFRLLVDDGWPVGVGIVARAGRGAEAWASAAGACLE